MERTSLSTVIRRRCPYVICFANGCMSDYDVTPALLASLRNGRSLTVQALGNTGRPLSRALPLTEFNQAYIGPPTDPKVFEAQQSKLQDELAQRANASRETDHNSPPATSLQPTSRLSEHAMPAATLSGTTAVPVGP